MKQVAGSLKLLYSQYRELQSFAQFGSDLDQPTPNPAWLRAQRIVEVLKQKNGAPVEVAHQVAILYAVTKGYLEQVEVEQVSAYEEKLHRQLDTRRPEILQSIRDTKMLTPENEAALKQFLHGIHRRVPIFPQLGG